ncbi:MAG: ferrochelatase [Acidimicrobiia bacterium]|nr:ferrochelatase [Acidimicrobiia bacterium]MYC46337.1 ferrochelatase [Acidimicrobiia bacterium]MYI19541.1 ferrochelatase [Acidimicrobiia bacterium]
MALDTAAPPDYDAVVVVSFGGPEDPEEVMPFLRNVTRGRGVPTRRLEEVAEHYLRRGGRSPINDQNRRLVAALDSALRKAGVDLPVYWGNRNWHPMLAEVVEAMRADGVRRSLAFVTSAFGSYSGCRQYREDIARAIAGCDGAPEIHKLRLYWNHPGFIEPMAEGVRGALSRLAGAHSTGPARLVFSAHSIPTAMAAGAPYERQLREAASLIAARVPTGVEDAHGWDLVYQSRSGPPSDPWLEPDVVDHLEALHREGVGDVVLVPLGFVSDHMEVIHDLDDEAAGAAAALGMRLERSPTVGTHPAFVDMIVELIRERLDPGVPRRALGNAGPWPDFCATDCCSRR